MRKFLLKLLGGELKPAIVKPNEFTGNTMARTVDDIKISVVATPEGRAITVSAWNPEIAIDLYKQVDDQITKKQPPKKEQPGVT